MGGVIGEFCACKNGEETVLTAVDVGIHSFLTTPKRQKQERIARIDVRRKLNSQPNEYVIIIPTSHWYNAVPRAPKPFMYPETELTTFPRVVEPMSAATIVVISSAGPPIRMPAMRVLKHITEVDIGTNFSINIGIEDKNMDKTIIVFCFPDRSAARPNRIGPAICPKSKSTDIKAALSAENP